MKRNLVMSKAQYKEMKNKSRLKGKKKKKK